MSIRLEGIFKDPNVFVEKIPIVAFAFLEDGNMIYVRIDEYSSGDLYNEIAFQRGHQNKIVSVVPVNHELYALDILYGHDLDSYSINDNCKIYSFDGIAFSLNMFPRPIVDFVNCFFDNIKNKDGDGQ